jgi:uncharacterized membrane protein
MGVPEWRFRGSTQGDLMKSTKESRVKAREKLKAKIRHELKTKAEREISRLLTELRDGTLDAKKLRSGLHKLRERLTKMPNHDT